jgi:hypothetical protein
LVDRARGTLSARAITAVPLHGQTNADAAIGNNCLALGIFHGAGKQSAVQAVSRVFMLYECFFGYTKVRSNAPLMRRAKVKAVGDALLLDLESGGQLLVYWHGDNYRGQYVRLGD